MWVLCLYKTNALNENDMLLLILDEHTKKHLECETILPKLISNINFIILPPPKTLLEGCMWKYNALTKDLLTYYNKDILFYCDIDVIFNKSFKNITDNMIPENIYIQEEEVENFTSRIYSDGIPIEEKNEFIRCVPSIKGISAGKFIIYGMSLALDIFNRIIEYNKLETNYYTLEQPFFNRAIYNFLCIEKKIPILYVMNNHVIRYNNIITNSSAIMIDCCGEPGKGIQHLNKVLNILCLFYFNSK